MASNLISLRPLNFAVNSHTHTRRPNNGRKPSSPPSLSSSSWWTPLFGWSSDPDYITEGNKTTDNRDDSSSSYTDERIKAKPLPSSLSSKPKFAPGCFTEEKARKLRMMTSDLESSSSHEMYHSAIASRLATDIPNRLHL